MSVDLSQLEIGTRLGDGAQAEVFSVENRPGQAFKQYRAHELSNLNAAALEDLAAETRSLMPEGRRISYWATWPTETVVSRGTIVGFLMPLIGGEFFLAEGRLAGKEASFSYLACEPAPFWGSVTLPGQEHRLVLLAQMAGILQALHHRRLVIGDISWNNVLWSTQEPRVLLLDCDGIRPAAGPPVAPQLDSPDFDDPCAFPGSPPDADRDCYKLALLVLRVLSRQLTARPDPSGGHGLHDLRPDQESMIERLLQRAAGRPGTRPTAIEWRQALQGRSVRLVQRPEVPQPTPKDLPLTDTTESSDRASLVGRPQSPLERKWRAVVPPKPPEPIAPVGSDDARTWRPVAPPARRQQAPDEGDRRRYRSVTKPEAPRP